MSGILKTKASANVSPPAQSDRNAPASSMVTSRKVTPPRSTYTNPSLVVDKKIVDELLLVCSMIGSTVDPRTQQIIPVQNCINWLQDLQRALRRDNEAFRPISLLFGQWKIVEQKLLPLVISCRYNTPLVLTIVKILVILTKPISEIAKNAATMIIDTRPGKSEEAVIKEQIKLRENALAQVHQLAEYKKIFIHHASHRPSKDSKEGGGLLSILISLLAEPLSKTGFSRTAEDHLTIELILHLIRNLLCAGDPLIKDHEKVQSSIFLQQELIALFEREMVLDFLLIIGQEMENIENKQYNLLMMEILYHMLKNQDPTLVARSIIKKNVNVSADSNAYASRSSSGASSLLNQLKKERQQKHAVSASRHSHFAGTFVQQKDGGHQRYRTASVQAQSQSRCGLMQNQTSIGAKKKTKKHHYFIGSSHGHAIYTHAGAEVVSNSQVQVGLVSRRAQNVLHAFCVRFMTQCYGPVMKSLKNEFRRDSSRLEASDKMVFFHLIWFFSQWWRVAVHEGGMKTLQFSVGSDENDDSSNKSIGPLIFTMDVFMFNIVLMSTDFFHAHKKYKDLSVAVSLYTEMMHLLGEMYHSSDSTEQIMAMGLMDRLFYQCEPMDRIPKLLSHWIPGTFTRDYVCDLLELTHTALKLLESNAKACECYRGSSKKSKKKKNTENSDAVERMRAHAADFDVIVYMARKIISNQSVFIFTQLLSQYNANAMRINHHIVSFFMRLCKFVVASDNDEYVENEVKVTLEPMLFNLPLLIVLNQILNDTFIQNDKTFEPVLAFASTLVRHFARSAEKNPMLYVEILFRHSAPHRFCESLSNMYVTEDLLLIAERDMLHEQARVISKNGQQQSSRLDLTRGAHESGAKQPNGPDDEDEDEAEFDDGESPEKRKVSQARRNNSTIASDDDDNQSDVSKNARSKTNVDVEDNDQQQSDPDKELDEEEDKWNDRRSFVPKRKLISREDISNDASSKSNADFQDNDQQSDFEKELDGEEDKWNDRRSFVPKRKRISHDDIRLGNEDQGNTMDLSNNTVLETSRKATQLDPKRVRRTGISDDSDDEDFNEDFKDTQQSSKRTL
eukprot:CAMPEP_0176484138 /NCGR_PEP_ID=MMETSP0200_2-20121128/4293_1 /TAXON_ID=947934 /ORGANISM="Chaetoceros sp., Strain GSL56" /LENGTH=1072 /DNA_ID=CAMNT_0017880589 /DNA_START=53 /DNA_END=3268 /DNA_ORIENTATION=+